MPLLYGGYSVEVSTSDCDSFSFGSNPNSHPICGCGVMVSIRAFQALGEVSSTFSRLFFVDNFHWKML